MSNPGEKLFTSYREKVINIEDFLYLIRAKLSNKEKK